MTESRTEAPEGTAGTDGGGEPADPANVITVTFEYAGDTVSLELPRTQRVEGAWHRVLAHFGIQPDDAANLALFHDGNEINRDQSFEKAGVPDGATLRIRPRVQRNGR